MKSHKNRGFHADIALKILVLAGFACFFLRTVFTGSVNRYVHPRIVPYMVFASFVMIAVALLLAADLFKPRERKAACWPMIVFLVPLLMAFALPAKSPDSDSGITGDVALSAGGGGGGPSPAAREPEASGGASASGADRAGPESGDAAGGGSEEEGLPLQNGVLVMNSDNFYWFISEIYENTDKYEGSRIETVGYVLKDRGFADDEFVPARLMMVCCAADMQPVGFLCRYGRASELAADSWVKVTGTVGKTQFQGETIPCIQAQSVEPAQKPCEDYVYPY